MLIVASRTVLLRSFDDRARVLATVCLVPRLHGRRWQTGAHWPSLA